MGKMKEEKMRTMYFQNLEMKDYVKKGTLYEARKTWEVRSHMLDLAGNFPGHKKYEQSDWKCQACNQQVREDQEHVMHCEGYVDLKEDADLTNEEELVQELHQGDGEEARDELGLGGVETTVQQHSRNTGAPR